MNRREARIAGPRGVVALVLEVIQERADQRRVEIGKVEFARLFAGLLLSEVQQQPERVAVGDKGAWAGVLLRDHPLGEERLKGRREQAHDAPPNMPFRRWPASASNSG